MFPYMTSNISLSVILIKNFSFFHFIVHIIKLHEYISPSNETQKITEVKLFEK